MPDIAYTAPEFTYAVVPIATDSTTITAKRSIVRGIFVNTVLSAHALPIYDGTVLAFTIPASAAAGTWYYLGDVVLNGGIIVDPDNAATGNVTVVYKEVM